MASEEKLEGPTNIDGSSSKPLQRNSTTPSIASTSNSITNSTNSSSSVPFHRHKENNNSFSSLFHPCRQSPRESTLSAMLAPAVNVAGAHNPFVIGGMREDGSRTRPHIHRRGSSDEHIIDQGDGESVASEDVSRLSPENKKRSKRHRLKSAFGRTLSPWSYHSETWNNQDKRRNGSNFGLNRLTCRDSIDLEGEKRKERKDDKESGTESDGESVKGGISPRNNAFGDGDSEDSDEGSRETFTRAKKSPNSDVTKDASSETTRESDASTVKEMADEGAPKTDEDEDSGGESDDYIDFDEQTLDNTLFNAGCIDLHDAWLKHDPHHSHASATPDEVKSSEVEFQDDYYGPNDYDAAWSGAGPTGHDEDDEALRAPNVVIGQASTISPSQLAGEGMEVLRESRDSNLEYRSASPFRKARPRPVSHSTSSSSMDPSRSSSSTRSDTNSKEADSIASKANLLTASRPVFERNRCTITLVHGDYDKALEESKRTKRYIVASDGSEESSYAIEWTIGTVLRDGDEMLIVSVMETEAKLDSADPKNEDKAARQEHQRIRQSMAVILARRATAVLQRTRLAVKVSCQALHARNSRHMFIDMIDFFEPTMCVVGSRGLNSIKGVLLGSFSNYCVQKSPVPVMVARKRLKLPALPRGKGDVVSNVRARHMRLDEAMIEKDANVAEEKPKEHHEEDEIKQEAKEKEKDKDKKKKDEKEAEEEEKKEEMSEAEKVKMAANVPSIETTPADEADQTQRGRAKFNIDEDEEEELERGRSRSRTPDVKS